MASILCTKWIICIRFIYVVTSKFSQNWIFISPRTLATRVIEQLWYLCQVNRVCVRLFSIYMCVRPPTVSISASLFFVSTVGAMCYLLGKCWLTFQCWINRMIACEWWHKWAKAKGKGWFCIKEANFIMYSFPNTRRGFNSSTTSTHHIVCMHSVLRQEWLTACKHRVGVICLSRSCPMIMHCEAGTLPWVRDSYWFIHHYRWVRTSHRKIWDVHSTDNVLGSIVRVWTIYIYHLHWLADTIISVPFIRCWKRIFAELQ